MKKRKIISLVGLAIVVAMTIFAAILPDPEASAISDFIDPVTIRVMDAPDVETTGITDGEIFVTEIPSFEITYENSKDVQVIIEYTDKDDVTKTIVFDEFTPDYVDGSKAYIVMPSGDFGYGDYVVTVIGSGASGSQDEASVSFHYYPIILDATEEPENDKYYADLVYTDEDITGDGEITEIILDVYGPDGNLIEALSQIVVTPPDTRVELKMTENHLPAGEYRVVATAYNEDGEILYKASIKDFYYTPPALAPDTGSFFNGINLSRADYLVAIIMFVTLFVASGWIIITKRKNKKS